MSLSELSSSSSTLNYVVVDQETANDSSTDETIQNSNDLASSTSQPPQLILSKPKPKPKPKSLRMYTKLHSMMA